jgi:hypothetical protein
VGAAVNRARCEEARWLAPDRVMEGRQGWRCTAADSRFVRLSSHVAWSLRSRAGAARVDPADQSTSHVAPDGPFTQCRPDGQNTGGPSTHWPALQSKVSVPLHASSSLQLGWGSCSKLQEAELLMLVHSEWTQKLSYTAQGSPAPAVQPVLQSKYSYPLQALPSSQVVWVSVWAVQV